MFCQSQTYDGNSFKVFNHPSSFLKACFHKVCQKRRTPLLQKEIFTDTPSLID